MILRARWQGELPQAGEFLMSKTRPRFAYAISAVDVLKDLPHHVPDFTRLKLHVERVAVAEVPPAALVHIWKWDARKKTGFVWSKAS